MVKTIKNIRLKQFDYSSNGYYYITLCSNYRNNFTDNEKTTILNHCNSPFMDIQGANLDFFYLVNNHMHFILTLDNCKIKLGEIIRRFKAITSKETKTKLWQPNYYEHTIRNEKSLDKIREYIQNNPLKEKMDFENIYKEI